MFSYRVIDKQKVVQIRLDVRPIAGHRHSDATQIAPQIGGHQWVTDATDDPRQSHQRLTELRLREKAVRPQDGDFDVQPGEQLSDRGDFVEPVFARLLGRTGHHIGGEVLGQRCGHCASGSVQEGRVEFNLMIFL